MKTLSQLILLLFFFSVYSQEKNSTYSYFLTKLLKFNRVHSDSALFYAKKLQSVASSPCEHLTGLKYEAHITYFKRDCEASKKLCLSTLDKIKKEITPTNKKCILGLKSEMIARLVYVEKCLGNYAKALEHLESNENLYKTYPNYFTNNHRLALSYQTALLYIELGWYDKAIELLKKNTNLTFEPENNLTLPSIHMALGDTYIKSFEKQKQVHLLDSAQIYYQKYFDLAVIIENQKIFTKKLFEIKKGIIALYQKKYEPALFHFHKAKNIKLTEDKHFTNQETYYYIAKTYSHLNEPDSLIFYGKKFIENHKLYPNTKDLHIEVYTLLANTYTKTKQFKEANTYASLALSKVKNRDTHKVNGFKKLNDLDLKKIKKSNKVILDETKNTELIYKIGSLSLIIILVVLLIILYRLHKKSKNKTLFPTAITPIPKKNIQIKPEQEKNITVSPSTVTANYNSINIKEDTAKKIIEGLNLLEKEKAFLNPDFNLNFIAKVLDTNTSYVSKVINFRTNYTFNEYMNNLRIQYIIKKLENNPKLRNYSLESIARDAGYSNASSFSKIFKKNIGISPSLFIKEHITKEKKQTTQESVNL